MDVRAGSRSLETVSQWAAGHSYVTVGSRVSSGYVTVVSHWVSDMPAQEYKSGPQWVLHPGGASIG